MFDKTRGETVGFGSLLGAPMLAELFAPRACSLLWRLRPWWPSGLSTYAVFWRGLFLLASLGMQRSRAVVLFSTLCRLRQGFFSFQEGFYLPSLWNADEWLTSRRNSCSFPKLSAIHPAFTCCASLAWNHIMFNPRRLDALIRSALTEDQIEIHLEQLVSGLEHDFYFFHILGTILPLEFNIFQRGRSTTNQKKLYRGAGDKLW